MKTLRGLGEVGLIARLAGRIRQHRSVLAGIGDDAAVIRWSGDGYLLFASDMLVEDVHFRLPRRRRGRSQMSASSIGWKALACNISDIAAMGGVPRYAVISLGLPPTTPVGFVDGLYQGLRRCATRFGMAIVGGDTVRSRGVVIDVAIVGSVTRRHLVLRSGAKPGDQLFVTGRLGGSLRSGRHARFVPRLAEARWLVSHVPVHAMIDLSDGLASDLWHLARASRATLRVDADRVPVAKAARTLRHALMDGEDFELLFAVPPGACSKIPRRLAGCPITQIGSVVGTTPRVTVQHSDGRITPITPEGFRHF